MHIPNYPSITSFQEHVQLKDFRAPTRKEYLRYVRKLAEHFQCDPATLSEDQIRQYFLFLRQHKRYKPATMKGAKYSLLCFYVEHLKHKGWEVFRDVRVVKPEVLPIVLSRAEVQALLGAVREPRFRTCLTLMYHCGLRVGEAVRIELKDIHGRENPPRLHVKNGKGGKDRYVPLAPGWIEGALGLTYLKKGDLEKAEVILEGMIDSRKKMINTSPAFIAFLAGELGKLDLAFEYLDKACEERDSTMVNIHIYAPMLSPAIAADPRYKSVLARLKLNI